MQSSLTKKTAACCSARSMHYRITREQRSSDSERRRPLKIKLTSHQPIFLSEMRNTYCPLPMGHAGPCPMPEQMKVMLLEQLCPQISPQKTACAIGVVATTGH